MTGWATAITASTLLPNFYQEHFDLPAETAKTAGEVTAAVLSSGVSNLRNAAVPGTTSVMGGSKSALLRDLVYFLGIMALTHEWHTSHTPSSPAEDSMSRPGVSGSGSSRIQENGRHG
jgi:hypothetical protein